MTSLSERMRKFVEFSREEPFSTTSAGGAAFRKAFVDFLEASADEDPKQVLSDFIQISARNVLAIHVLQHDGNLCIDCLEELCDLLAEQIADDAEELAEDVIGMRARKH